MNLPRQLFPWAVMLLTTKRAFEQELAIVHQGTQDYKRELFAIAGYFAYSIIKPNREHFPVSRRSSQCSDIVGVSFTLQ